MGGGDVRETSVGHDVLEARIQCLERQMKQQRQLTRDLLAWVDTMSSPILKRVWWTLCGFRFRRVGRWREPDRTYGWPPPDRFKGVNGH